MKIRVLAFNLLLSLFVPALYGHVLVLNPNGGEVLDVGSVYTLEWKVLLEHNTQNWDLWYSTEGEDGPWKVIEEDVPTGDPTMGSIHTYEWIVPEDISETVRIRVEMDNLVENFDDMSDEDLSITHVALEADPNPVSGNEILTLEAKGSALPGAPAALFLVEANSTPFFVLLALVNLDGQGSWSLSGTIPTGLSGATTTFQMYAQKPSGKIVAGHKEVVHYQ